MKKQLKGKVGEFKDNFLKAIRRPEMAILPGQLAFFFVLSIVPTITLITYVASLFNLSTDVIYNFLVNVFSKDIAELVLNPLPDSISGFSLFTLILMGYYIASTGCASIIITSNTIYGEKRTPFITRKIKSLIMTFFLVVLFLFMLVVPVFGDSIISLLNMASLNKSITINIIRVIKILQGPLTWLIIYIFIKLLYTLAPNKQIKSRNVGYGALFTSVGWVISTSIYSFYINNYAHYTTFYGSLANIVVLMLWFYLLAFIFTIGIALNYRKEEIEEDKR